MRPKPRHFLAGALMQTALGVAWAIAFPVEAAEIARDRARELAFEATVNALALAAVASVVGAAATLAVLGVVADVAFEVLDGDADPATTASAWDRAPERWVH